MSGDFAPKAIETLEELWVLLQKRHSEDIAQQAIYSVLCYQPEDFVSYGIKTARHLEMAGYDDSTIGATHRKKYLHNEMVGDEPIDQVGLGFDPFRLAQARRVLRSVPVWMALACFEHGITITRCEHSLEQFAFYKKSRSRYQFRCKACMAAASKQRYYARKSSDCA
jgi:hypothetical protein